MGQLVPFNQSAAAAPDEQAQRESKVFTKHFRECLALANVVSRELRRFNCRVVLSGLNGQRPFLVVETDRPLHLERRGYFRLALVPTPGEFLRCRTLLLGCEIEWRPRATAALERVH